LEAIRLAAIALGWVGARRAMRGGWRQAGRRTLVMGG
jgi:hypothetical protein